MGVDGNGQLGFQHSSDLMLNCCPSSGMNTGSLSEKPVSSLAMNSMFGSSNGGKESCYGSDWGPVVPLNQSENLGASLMVSNADLAIHPYPIVTYTKGLSGTSQFMHYSSDTSVAEMLPKFPVLGGGSFSGIFNSYNLPGCAQNSGVFAPPNHASNKGVMIEKATVDSVHSQEDPQVLEERLRLASPNGKRKRNAGGDMQRDSAGDISEMKELDEKKQKTEESGSSDQSNKQTGKQIKDNCSADEESKGYIHVRARRGQATNSHSLAERLRREKINERMRLLQELVPGCSKITGKAVMLDEIINYVQSLQQQVEFLSMKLASVNPELNFDIDQILSKDSLHSRGILGLNLGTSSNHIGTPGIHQGGLPVISNLSSLYHHSIPQGMWDGDLQNLHHMGFDPNPTAGNLGPNGS